MSPWIPRAKSREQRAESLEQRGESEEQSLQPIHLMKRYLIEIIVIVIISASYGFAAHQRNFVWKDNLSLWSDVVKKSAGKARPHDYMGIACYKSRLINDAIKHHKLAINIDPEYPYPYVNLAYMLF